MAALPFMASLPASGAFPAGDVPRRWGKRGSTGGLSRDTRAPPTADGRRWRLESGLERVDVHVHPFAQCGGEWRGAVGVARGVKGDSPIFVNHGLAAVPAKIGTVPSGRRSRR